MQLEVQIPKALEFLFHPSRYKVAYGGRGSAKSWSFARALLVKSLERPRRILCAREIQRSIKDSVIHLLADQIRQLGLSDQFTVKATTIENGRGSEFIFEGLRYNVDSIRSLEGIDICAVFEAKNVSKNSWETLIPTIRKSGSEIWVEFNPELETDETYRRFVSVPPTDAVVRKVNYHDNPWFPEVLKQEVEDLRSRDIDAYLNVWEGHCRAAMEGAIFANELRAATSDNRITRVPYDESTPVHTFWDLGWSDCTSIWFVQKIGFEYHLIDCYQNRLHKLNHYLQVLQSRNYVYGKDYLPHDADNEGLGSESIAKTMKKMGRDVVVVPRVQDKPSGLKAAREIFSSCWFDSEKCQDGLQALRHYRYDIDEHGQWSKYPSHDENSHYADAFEQFARSISRKHELDKGPKIEIINISKEAVNTNWMG